MMNKSTQRGGRMLQSILCSILTVSMVQAAGSKKPMKDDEIQTEQSPMQLKPFSDVQLSMDRQSALKIHQTQKLIELMKGTIRVKAKTESENKEALIKA